MVAFSFCKITHTVFGDYFQIILISRNEFYRNIQLILSLDKKCAEINTKLADLEENLLLHGKNSGDPPNLVLLQELRAGQVKSYNLQSEKIAIVKECKLMVSFFAYF